jgi:hypothetical protein
MQGRLRAKTQSFANLASSHSSNGNEVQLTVNPTTNGPVPTQNGHVKTAKYQGVALEPSEAQKGVISAATAVTADMMTVSHGPGAHHRHAVTSVGSHAVTVDSDARNGGDSPTAARRSAGRRRNRPGGPMSVATDDMAERLIPGTGSESVGMDSFVSPSSFSQSIQHRVVLPSTSTSNSTAGTHRQGLQTGVSVRDGDRGGGDSGQGGPLPPLPVSVGSSGVAAVGVGGVGVAGLVAPIAPPPLEQQHMNAGTISAVAVPGMTWEGDGRLGVSGGLSQPPVPTT